jgi:hypothetical protein
LCRKISDQQEWRKTNWLTHEKCQTWKITACLHGCLWSTPWGGN